MGSTVLSLVSSVCLFASAGDAVAGSYLYTPTTGRGGVTVVQVEPYTPQAGDMVLFDDEKLLWHVLYPLAGTSPPDHSGIMIRLPDGRPAVLESGPDNGTRVCILEATSRLATFQGKLWIRRLQRPLEPEQSERLTEFALAQEGKRYATARLLLQGTPFRCRGQLRKHYFGNTYLDRRSWLCSELVVAAGTVAGLFDPNLHPANAIYPRDIIDDNTYDLSAIWRPAGLWRPHPPEAVVSGQAP